MSYADTVSARARTARPFAFARLSIALFTLAALLLALGARPGGAAPMPDVDAGGLFLRGDDRLTPAPLVGTDIHVAVSGMTARATIRQEFHNPGTAWVEGLYVFPLPEGAAVDRLRLRIGERIVTGRIAEREQAARAYHAARDQGRRAGLVEQERPNIFTTSIANIGPGETVSVEIEFQDTPRFDQGAFSLRVPLVVAPRYIPGEPILVAARGWAPATTSVPDAPRITPPVRHPAEGPANPVRLRVEIDAGMDLAAITSATHAIDVAGDASGRAIVTLAEGVVPADRDFEVRWRPAIGAEPRAGAFVEDRGDLRHVLVMLVPPKPAEVLATPRETIFVIDTSGSMAGPSMEQAKSALQLALTRLTPSDRFNVIQFNSTASSLFAGAVAATPEAVSMARAYVGALRAEGGTEMLQALDRALDGRTDPGRVRQIVFLTDGAVGNEDALFRRIQARLGDSRLFTIGIGAAPNGWFMTRAAQAGRGTFTNIDRIDQVGARMAALFEKLEKPVLTDLAVTWPAGTEVEAYPAPLPDLYAGEPVVLAARWPVAAMQQGARMTIEGRIAGQPWRQEVALDAMENRPGIAALWARRKLGALADTLYERGDAAAVREASVALALSYQLVSKYTNLVAIDETRARPDNAPVQRGEVPVNLPAGWEYDAVFGGAAGMRHAAAGGPMIAMQNPSAPVALPQTATPATRQLMLGTLLAALGVLLLAKAQRNSRRRSWEG